MNRETYKGLIKKLKNNEIFVFGSNPQGRHGAGAANIAYKKFGAIYGQGRGIQGQSYALVTKNLKSNYLEKETNILYNKKGLKSLSPKQIIFNIKELCSFARKNRDKKFLIAYLGISNNITLNGYSCEEMVSFFKQCKPIPKNIIFEENFNKMI